MEDREDTADKVEESKVNLEEAGNGKKEEKVNIVVEASSIKDRNDEGQAKVI